MRIGRFTTAETDQCWYGVSVSDQEIVNVPEACTAAGVDLPETDSTAPVDDAWQRHVERGLEHARETNTAVYSTREVERLAPITDPEKIVCVGLNYRDHAEEGDNPSPDEPVLFSKFPTTISGPGDTISWDPDLTEKVDYEAELVVVIGKETWRVDEEEALEHVAGYMVGNDVSARDLQHGDGQWVRGKGLDGFAPIGPDLVTADEVSDPHDLEIWAEVNGERLQESTTDNLIFGVDELVAFCSRAFTLQPGDLIFTGTPPGVGVYREPPVLLEDGDSVTVGVEGLGELTNGCRYA